MKSWTRYQHNPIVRNGDRGSATYPAANPLSSTQPPTTDARDSRFASNPFVVQNGRDFAMFYYGFRYCAVSGQYHNEVRGIAVARSKPW